MDDLPIQDPGGQVLAGPIQTELPGFPDTTITWWPGAVGDPANHPAVRLQLEDGHEIAFTFHRITLTVESIPNTVLELLAGGESPTDLGGIFRAINGTSYIQVPDAEALIARLHAVSDSIARRRSFSARRGRRPGATIYPRDVIRDKLAESNRLRQQGYSRAKRAARLAIPEGTLKDWEEKREKDPNFPN